MTEDHPKQVERIVDSVRMPDGTQFVLSQEGDDWMVRVAGRMLMSSKVVDSEDALAEEAFERAGDLEEILVGGLGLGFTLRAALDLAPPDAFVTVAELVPKVVEWNRRHVGVLNEHPLCDERVEVVEGHVLELIQGASERFDVILLDVDNGPVALSSADNDALYSASGLNACHKALAPDGILAVWSSGASSRFERAMKKAHFEVEVLKVGARAGSRAHHVIFIGRRLPGKPRGRRGGANAR